MTFDLIGVDPVSVALVFVQCLPPTLGPLTDKKGGGSC